MFRSPLNPRSPAPVGISEAFLHITRQLLRFKGKRAMALPGFAFGYRWLALPGCARSLSLRG